MRIKIMRLDWSHKASKKLKCRKILFSIPKPFSDICYTYDGLVSTVLPSGRIARTVFYCLVGTKLQVHIKST